MAGAHVASGRRMLNKSGWDGEGWRWGRREGDTLADWEIHSPFQGGLECFPLSFHK